MYWKWAIPWWIISKPFDDFSMTYIFMVQPGCCRFLIIPSPTWEIYTNKLYTEHILLLRRNICFHIFNALKKCTFKSYQPTSNSQSTIQVASILKSHLKPVYSDSLTPVTHQEGSCSFNISICSRCTATMHRELFSKCVITCSLIKTKKETLFEYQFMEDIQSQTFNRKWAT